MGTNFYLVAPEYDGLDDPGLHIGKRSGGWAFHWRSHPNLHITTRADWERLLDGPAAIVDEYGTTVTVAEFRAIVEDAARTAVRSDMYRGDYHDPDGNRFTVGEFG